MTRLSCVIFDLDGTVTQTNQLIFATFNHVTQKYINKTFGEKEIIAMFGPPEEVAIERLVGSQQAAAAMEDFHAFYASHHPEFAMIHEGIQVVLEFLKRRGLIVALFTGKGKRSTLTTLHEFGITKYFDLIVTGQDVTHHKPSADGIVKVLERFGLSPEEVLMVGDAVADVKAAREAGVKIAAVLWDSYGKDQVMQMDIDYSFHNVEEFFAFLKSILPTNGDARH